MGCEPLGAGARLAAAALTLAGCSIQADLTQTRFHCDVSADCPDRTSCQGNVCVVTRDGGASTDGPAATPDAKTVVFDAHPPPDAAQAFDCESPQPIELGVQFGGTTQGQPRTHNAACSSTNGPEMVFALELDAGDVPITLDVSTDFPATQYDTVLYVRSACALATELACDDGDADVGETVQFTAVAAGTYYIFVDSHNESDGGQFTLLVTNASF